MKIIETVRKTNLKRLLGKLAKFDLKQIQAAGWHLQRNDYYSPLNDIQFLEQNRDLWKEPVDPPCVDWNQEGQMSVAEEVSTFVDELKNVPQQTREKGIFYWQNEMWNNADALVQYGLVRSRQPKRYIEIGCGWSSMLLRDALKKNEAVTEVTLIEPYPNPNIFPHLPNDWTRYPAILQRAPIELFETLEAGDILFYDGSHCTKVGSDVNFFFFNVLPRIKPGVLIHIHDIFFPWVYPEPWIMELGQTWNEQFVLQAFLMHNNAYRVFIANAFLGHHKSEELKRLYNGIQPHYGCSFWMEKVGI